MTYSIVTVYDFRQFKLLQIIYTFKKQIINTSELILGEFKLEKFHNTANWK